ncbi:MAG: hypothetical protein ACSLFP_00845 [Acidimicrobiales bacterium]
MLMPAGVLVVLLLGAIAFDLSLVFLRQRQATSVAVDVANDLATLALDEAAFRAGDGFRLDPARAVEVGELLVGGSDLADHVVEVSITVTDRESVEVVLVVSVDYVFARAVPGVPKGTTVEARAAASTVS